MSGFSKARQQNSGDDAGPDYSLLCRVPSCGKRWSVDINHGRVCSFHDEQFSRAGASRGHGRPAHVPGPAPLPLPSIPPQRPHNEPDNQWDDRGGYFPGEEAA